MSAAAAGVLARPAVRASREGLAATGLGSFFMMGVAGVRTATAGEDIMEGTAVRAGVMDNAAGNGRTEGAAE